YLVAVERLGLAEAVAHWHWPNFEACAEIVPLADPDALLLALKRRRSGAGARLKAALWRALLRGGPFARLAPCFSGGAAQPVSANNANSRECAMNMVLTYLEANRQRLDLARYGLPERLSSMMVTPRFRTSNHVVFLVLAPGRPEPLLVAKLPRLSGSICAPA